MNRAIYSNSLILAMSMLLLSGCSAIHLDLGFQRSDELRERIILQDNDAYPEIDLLALSPAIEDFLATHVDENLRSQEKVDRLRELLFGEDYLNIAYDDAQTYTAAEVFEARAGNCLSVVSLYIAMARHVGLDAQFQTVKVMPEWDRRGEVLVISEHINAVGRINQRTQYVFDFTPEIRLQQLTTSKIGDAEARALYFNNLGVEQVVRGNYEESLAFFRNALRINPDLSLVWNNIGTAFKRTGEGELAEYSYQKAFDLDNSNPTAINNLAKFYSGLGDEDTAATFRRAVRRFNNRNPYYHYVQGNSAYLAERFEDAQEHYQRAIRRKDVEPDFYLALALTYEQLGFEDRAVNMVETANALLQGNGEIYRPSSEKVRIIRSDSLFRSSSSGVTIHNSGITNAEDQIFGW